MSRRNVRKIRRINSDRDALDYMRDLITESARNYQPRKAAWNGVPIKVALTSPRKGQSQEATLKAWGLPPTLDNLEGLVHHSRGGWGILELPPMVEVYSWVAKTAKHPDAIVHLDLISRAALHSQLALSEALSLCVECAQLTPFKRDHPREAANIWAHVAIHAINVWQARHAADSEGLGDAEAVARHIYQLKEMCAQWQIDQLELDLEKRRSRHRRSA